MSDKKDRKEASCLLSHHSSLITFVACGDEEVAAEAFGRVEPRLRAFEAGLGGERGESVEVVLVGVLRVYALAHAEVYGDFERLDAYGLLTHALKMHLDAPLPLVIKRDVPEVAY